MAKATRTERCPGCGGVIVGWRTFQAVGHVLARYGRTPIVLGRGDGAVLDALSRAEEAPGGCVWVAGGAAIYRQMAGVANALDLTLVHTAVPNADT